MYNIMYIIYILYIYKRFPIGNLKVASFKVIPSV